MKKIFRKKIFAFFLKYRERHFGELQKIKAAVLYDRFLQWR